MTPLKTSPLLSDAVAITFPCRGGPNSRLLGQAFLFAWSFIATHRASWAHPPFNAPTYREVASAWLEPLARLGVSAGILALSAAALTEHGAVAVPWHSPALWLLSALTIWLLPPALLFANIEGEGAQWIIQRCVRSPT